MRADITTHAGWAARLPQAVAALAALALAHGAGAVEPPADYDACIALVAADPAGAELAAGEWARFGGGAPARHCYALALIAIGAPVRAAEELLAIAAEEPDLPDAARAEIVVQAGELLLDRGNLAAAVAAADRALDLVAGLPDALALRGQARLAGGAPAAAIADFDRALAEGPADPRILLRRAAAHRLSGALTAARDDAIYATELAPDIAAAWLERGRIETRLGDRNSARRSYLAAIDLDRDGEIGVAARTALQRMEAGID